MKVIHVYLIFKKNYYFGSLSAIFEHLDGNRHRERSAHCCIVRMNPSTILTNGAIIIKSTLLRCGKSTKKIYDYETKKKQLMKQP